MGNGVIKSQLRRVFLAILDYRGALAFCGAVSAILTLATFFTSCSERPQIVQPGTRLGNGSGGVNGGGAGAGGVGSAGGAGTGSGVGSDVALRLDQLNSGRAAVWLATSNYSSGGSLGRLDLTTGLLNAKVKAIGSDAVIFDDPAGPAGAGLLVLHRMTQDAVIALQGPTAQFKGQFKLVESVNAQAALRDTQGRVWVTAYESNSVTVLGPDLHSVAGSIDLGGLVEPDSVDHLAELSQMVELSNGQVLVSAQNLNRMAGGWVTNPESSYALIDKATLGVEFSGRMAAPNPVRLQAQGNSAWVVGSGDLSSIGPLVGSIGLFSGVTRQLVNQASGQASAAARILDAGFKDGANAPAVIAWYPQVNQSCIEQAGRKILCAGDAQNGGYVFNKLLWVGDALMISYVGDQNAELWVVSLQGGDPIKLSLPMQIVSMSFGP